MGLVCKEKVYEEVNKDEYFEKKVNKMLRASKSHEMKVLALLGTKRDSRNIFAIPYSQTTPYKYLMNILTFEVEIMLKISKII